MAEIVEHTLNNFEIHVLFPSQTIPEEDIDAALHQDEITRAAAISHPGRRLEFIRSRWLIRQNLAFQGPILANPSGFITWPQGVSGSISHKNGVVAFAFSSDSTHRSLGIDLEDANGVKVELIDKICCAAEKSLLHSFSQKSGLSTGEVLAIFFSFKESIFKCHFPLGRTWFYFLDAEIFAADPRTGAISARLNLMTSPRTGKGFICHGQYSFLTQEGCKYVLTSHSVPQ